MALARNKKKVTKATVGSALIALILFLFTLSLLLVLLWGFNTSLKTYFDYHDCQNIIGLPNLNNNLNGEGLFNNYIIIMKGFSFAGNDESYYSSIFGYIQNVRQTPFQFGDLLLNSFLYCFIGAFTKSFVALACGYLVTKYKYKFSKIIYVVMLVIMAIPIVGSIPAMLKVTKDLAIFDTYLGMFILNFNFTGLYFFVFAAYFESYNDVYIEAAEIDGSNQFFTFIRIVFPMAQKLFWTIFLLNFIALWNDYQTPLLYYPNHPTLSYGVYRMYAKSSTIAGLDGAIQLPQRAAGCMILAIPVLILFLSTKNILLGNMSAGGIKEWGKNSICFYPF